MENIITVENISKKYQLKHQLRSGYSTLRDSIADGVKGITNKLNIFTVRDQSINSKETFWALDDVSFHVKQGDRIGIIGRNGAGKSTILKIITRITEPTKGRIVIRGRISSLLEVGTGFHPELTGRENIYLNGTILGMTRLEIKRKFDEIVEFAEIEKFLDTPVKRYSSGMYVRLAFSVAAHLEPEILVVDEVLAVGDVQFQKKCLNKMEDVSNNSGRTILFVSHNMGAIERLCNKSIILSQGKLVAEGETGQIISQYLNTREKENLLLNRKDRFGDGTARVNEIYFCINNNVRSQTVKVGEPFELIATMKLSPAILDKYIQLNIILSDQNEYRLTCLQSDEIHIQEIQRDELIRFHCHVPGGLPFTPGTYFITVSLVSRGCLIDRVRNAIDFEVVYSDYFDGKTLPDPRFGCLYLKNQWQINGQNY